MASEAMTMFTHGTMMPQGEASRIAAEIVRLSTKLQAVVADNTELRTASLPMYSNVSLLTSTFETFSECIFQSVLSFWK